MTWNKDIGEEDALTIGDMEIEELDNDEINANEAGFLLGYEAEDEAFSGRAQEEDEY